LRFQAIIEYPLENLEIKTEYRKKEPLIFRLGAPFILSRWGKGGLDIYYLIIGIYPSQKA